MKAKLPALPLAVVILLIGCKPGETQAAGPTSAGPSGPAAPAAPVQSAPDAELTPDLALTVLRTHFADHSVMCAYGTTFPLRIDRRGLTYRPGLQHLIDAGVVNVEEQNAALTLTPQAPYFDRDRGLMCAGITEPLAVTLKPVNANLVGAEFTLNIKGVQPWASSPLTTANANPGFMRPAQYAGKTLTGDAQLERISEGWRVVRGSVGKPRER